MPFYAYTGVRLKGESRYGTKYKIIGYFSDGAGGMFRVATMTNHFANGTWFEERTFSGYDGDPYTITDTDYDSSFNYGAPISPYTTWSFADATSDNDMRTHLSSISPDWDPWDAWFEISTTSQETAHYYQSTSQMGGFSYYMITNTGGNFEGSQESILGETVHWEARLAVHTPIPCEVRWDNDTIAGTPTTYAITPGALVYLPEVALNEGGYTYSNLDQITFLPWAS